MTNNLTKENQTMETYLIEMTGSPVNCGWKTKDAFLLDVQKFAQVFNSKMNTKTQIDYLVTCNMKSETAKMARAKKLGIPVVTYTEFMELI